MKTIWGFQFFGNVTTYIFTCFSLRLISISHHPGWYCACSTCSASSSFCSNLHLSSSTAKKNSYIDITGRGLTKCYIYQFCHLSPFDVVFITLSIKLWCGILTWDFDLQMFKLEDVAMGIWINEMKKEGFDVKYENDGRILVGI